MASAQAKSVASPGTAPATIREFAITRTFDAPRPTVFRAWTEADRLARWFGPPGASIVSCSLDLRPGGAFHYGLRMPDGRTLWARWTFREVVAPERLVFTFSFSDESGGLARNPFAPVWPREVLSTLTLAEHDGRTTLTMRAVPLDATPDERQAYLAGHESMRKGWAGTLDKLDEFLAQS
jgi:uncharacterized protein YndB with AHSA1/START domain